MVFRITGPIIELGEGLNTNQSSSHRQMPTGAPGFEVSTPLSSFEPMEPLGGMTPSVGRNFITPMRRTFRAFRSQTPNHIRPFTCFDTAYEKNK